MNGGAATYWHIAHTHTQATIRLASLRRAALPKAAPYASACGYFRSGLVYLLHVAGVRACERRLQMQKATVPTTTAWHIHAHASYTSDRCWKLPLTLCLNHNEFQEQTYIGAKPIDGARRRTVCIDVHIHAHHEPIGKPPKGSAWRASAEGQRCPESCHMRAPADT